MRIYLDIDGVLLANETTPALYAEEFIEYLTKNHEVYWLTTHCRSDAIPTQQHLAQWFTNQNTLRALGKILPTNWDTWKTEAIDFTQPFLWIDDDLFDEEKQELEAHNALDNFVLVDLYKDPHDLKAILQTLQN